MIAPDFDAPTEWDKDETPQGQTALMRGLTVYLFDQNGTQLALRPARYAKQCAHVAVGLPHKSKAGFRVNKVFPDTNHALFTDADGNRTTEECSDAAPRNKGKTGKKRRS